MAGITFEELQRARSDGFHLHRNLTVDKKSKRANKNRYHCSYFSSLYSIVQIMINWLIQLSFPGLWKLAARSQSVGSEKLFRLPERYVKSCSSVMLLICTLEFLYTSLCNCFLMHHIISVGREKKKTFLMLLHVYGMKKILNGDLKNLEPIKPFRRTYSPNMFQGIILSFLCCI